MLEILLIYVAFDLYFPLTVAFRFWKNYISIFLFRPMKLTLLLWEEQRLNRF
jgi:hypothetical protein